MEYTRETLLEIIERKRAGESVQDILFSMGIPYNRYMSLRRKYRSECKHDRAASQKYSDEFIQSLCKQASEKSITLTALCKQLGLCYQTIFHRLKSMPDYRDLKTDTEMLRLEKQHAYQIKRINKKRSQGLSVKEPAWIKDECIVSEETNEFIHIASEGPAYPGEMEEIKRKLKKGCNHCVHRNFCANDENFACCAYLPDIKTYLKCNAQDSSNSTSFTKKDSSAQ